MTPGAMGHLFARERINILAGHVACGL